jgi:hypothetical protein
MTPLEKSIEHWEKNTTANTPDKASTSSKDCALCTAWDQFDCLGCPVRDKTEISTCYKTPYREAFDSLVSWTGDPSNSVLKAAFRRAAKKELNFLKGLLP